MSTQKETVEFILHTLGHSDRFSARAMFGEYALYADKKVVALICDNQLYVKILPASKDLEDEFEKGEPYPGAKPHYLIEEDRISDFEKLPRILLKIAASLPEKKRKSRAAKNK